MAAEAAVFNERSAARRFRAQKRDERREVAEGGGLRADLRPEDAGKIYGAVPGIMETPYDPYRDTDAGRFSEPEPERFDEKERGRFSEPESERFNEPTTDMDRGRALREAKRESKEAVAEEGGVAGGAGRIAGRAALQAEKHAEQAVAKVRQVAELAKNIRNVRAILTAVGLATAATGIGLIWTFIQWHAQIIYEAIGAPGNEYVKLPLFAKLLLGLIDFIVLVVLAFIFIMMWAISEPKEAACTFAELASDAGFVASIISYLTQAFAC